MDGREIHNEADIAELLQNERNNNRVGKPDAGTHGKSVKLAKERLQLENILREVKPSIINPVGVLAQNLVEKWFYDLRIIVTKYITKMTSN